MKKHLLKLALLATLAATPAAHAQLNIPSDGSDGVFAPITNVVIDLRLATTGNWDINNSGNAGYGVYDWTKWAIVFKWQSVFIPTNVTVTFINHGSRAPVVWLVQSNVVINGTVSLDSASFNPYDSALAHMNPEGGPGAGRGGASLLGSGSGLGPKHGYFRTGYGNPSLIPLIGASGSNADSRRAGGGGGAILIATPMSVMVGGVISANGGGSVNGESANGGGIRLVADSLTGPGKIRANDQGRIRIEANTFQMSQATEPEQIAVKPSPTPKIFPDAGSPTARIVSVAGFDAPLDPRSPLVGSADLVIQTNQATVVLVETRNFPIEGAVNVRLMPKYAGEANYAALRVSGSYAQAVWRATLPFAPGYSTLQVRAIAP